MGQLLYANCDSDLAAFSGASGQAGASTIASDPSAKHDGAGGILFTFDTLRHDAYVTSPDFGYLPVMWTSFWFKVRQTMGNHKVLYLGQILHGSTSDGDIYTTGTSGAGYNLYFDYGSCSVDPTAVFSVNTWYWLKMGIAVPSSSACTGTLDSYVYNAAGGLVDHQHDSESQPANYQPSALLMGSKGNGGSNPAAYAAWMDEIYVNTAEPSFPSAGPKALWLPRRNRIIGVNQ